MSDGSRPIHDNLATYSRAEVVTEYVRADYLSGAEQALFGRHIAPGMRILDLGVGGGRTSPVLAQGAEEYVGVDYSPAMVEACRRRFPQWRYEVMDAADLSAFGSGHFDAVVFSFNGMGHLYPDAQRARCLAECRRVLRPGGVLIFSLHHARSLFFRLPSQDSPFSIRPVLGVLWRSAKRFATRIVQPFFWKQSGYYNSDTHGGMHIYLATPRVVCSQLEEPGFAVLEVLGDDYPAANCSWATRWYYYAARAGK